MYFSMHLQVSQKENVDGESALKLFQNMLHLY